MRRILPALAAALACAACTVPIFDPSMSWAARTLDNIPVLPGQVTDQLPIPREDGKPRFDLQRDRFSFMPERIPGGFDISKGFVIRNYENWNEIWYEWFGGSTVQWMQGPFGSTYPAGETMPLQVPVWLKTGPYLGAIVFDSEAWAERMWANTAGPSFLFSPGYHSLSLPNDINAEVAPPIGAIPHIVGMSTIAQSLPAQDRVTALVRTGAGYTEATSLLDFNGPAGWSAVWAGFVNYPLGTFLGSPGHLNYCHDFNAPGRSFAQSYDGKKWTTWTWWSAVPDHAKLTGITHRIDTVLSTDAGPGASHLFSTEDGIGRVYRYDGTGTGELAAQFALGPLRFLGEAYIGAEWKMLFSCCVIDYKNGQIRFQIRAINTNQLLAAFGS